MIRSGGYAVVDLETTGFSPAKHDRVVEVAVVQVDAHGRIKNEWVTLVNPQRDLGPQHIHGISAADVVAAPTFAELAYDLALLLQGRVLVAHNAAFDRRFLAAEFTRAGWSMSITAQDCLCTMRLASTYLPVAARTLAICCECAGVVHDGAHSALGDARAAAGLLAYYLAIAVPPPWIDLLNRMAQAPPLPMDRPSVRPVHRGASAFTQHWTSTS